jgi:hypothetical protein
MCLQGAKVRNWTPIQIIIKSLWNTFNEHFTKRNLYLELRVWLLMRFNDFHNIESIIYLTTFAVRNLETLVGSYSVSRLFFQGTHTHTRAHTHTHTHTHTDTHTHRHTHRYTQTQTHTHTHTHTQNIMFVKFLMFHNYTTISFLNTQLDLVASFFNILAVSWHPRRRIASGEAESLLKYWENRWGIHLHRFWRSFLRTRYAVDY